MKVLLVDDDAFLRDMYALKFKERGDEVSAVSGGKEALARLTKEEFDIVVMDMVMPQMTGMQLLEAIQQQYPEQRCIVLSNQGENFDKDAAAKAGAVGYIVKADMIPSQVVERVHTILEDIAVLT